MRVTIWPDKQIVGPGGASVNHADATPPTLIRKLLQAAGWEKPVPPKEVCSYCGGVDEHTPHCTAVGIAASEAPEPNE